MTERQPERVQRLSRKRDRAELLRPVDVALLADQGVAAQARLDADLIPFPRHELHFDHGRTRQLLDHAVMTDGFLAASIARVRLLLNQRSWIPDQMIAPRARQRRRVTVHDGLVDALRLMPFELRLQRRLRRGGFREQDETRRVAIDPVDDERPAPAAPAEVGLEILEERRRVMAPLRGQRYGEQSGRLVQDDEHIVLVDDRQIAIVTERRAALRAARTVHPQADDVANGEPRGGLAERCLPIVDEHLAAFECIGRARARSGPIRGGQILVEPDAGVFESQRPLRHVSVVTPTKTAIASGRQPRALRARRSP